MQGPDSDSSLEIAPQVCASCKARKRKCDKALPKCSLCSKKNLACDYSTSEQARNSAPTPESLWYSTPISSDGTDSQLIDFPTILFLDPALLQHGQIEDSEAPPPVPSHILHLLGDMNDIRNNATSFFEHIHSWMPFISKKRFYEQHLRASFKNRPDIAVLLLAVTLVTTLPPTTPRNPRTPLYHTAKHYYVQVENSSVFSIPVLQAGVLLALYELGQASYPAAFLSIGACARYAHALGINVSGKLNSRRVLTLVEVEERKRVWWAIVILDRFVSIGCPGRPFATAQPKLDDLLPSDDAAWDDGLVKRGDSFTLSSPSNAHMSKFALLCQAARLLGQVLDSVSRDWTRGDNDWIQLDRTLQSMVTASLEVELPDYDQIAFAYSALVALHTPWLSSDGVSQANKDRSEGAKLAIQRITERISSNLVERECFIGRDPEGIPPWGLFFAYRICVAYMHHSRETWDSSEVVKSLKETLLAINVRWNVAGVYLQLLEAQECEHNFHIIVDILMPNVARDAICDNVPDAVETARSKRNNDATVCFARNRKGAWFMIGPGSTASGVDALTVPVATITTITTCLPSCGAALAKLAPLDSGDSAVDMVTEPSICQALQLSDARQCPKEATHANGLFCWFHAKQVFGLYKGYKRRNAQLDANDGKAPSYLKDSRVPLANETFEGIEDEETLNAVHSHLFEKYVLIGQIIDARKLHHKHFYSLDCDYGHQAYIDRLSSQRYTVLQSLTKLVKRTTDVLYKKEQWFSWVSMAQTVEEATRDKEQKKVKQESALFKRHAKKLQARMERARQEEEKKRQDAYLEDAYQARMAMSADTSEDDEMWDPIEDVDHDKRQQYIDLIKHFLWMEIPAIEESPRPSTGEPMLVDEPQAPTKKPKKKPKTKGGASKPGAVRASASSQPTDRGQRKLVAMQENDEFDDEEDLFEPDRNSIETEEEMRRRLSQGVDKKLDNVWGIQLVGTLANPHETHARTAPMTTDEIETAVKDIREIKLLLFSRLLLAHASLLPVALRAGSVQELLGDTDISDTDLRDLCLKLEEPSLQQVRDACADFARGDEVDENISDVSDEDTEDEEGDYEDLVTDHSRYNHLHTDDWLLKKLARRKDELMGKKKKPPPVKTKVIVCGRSVWNHASERAMSRDGWLQFSIIAKDCDLKHAVKLCRNWAEFSSLNILTLWGYFPTANWTSWGNNRLVQQLQELEFYPYFIDLDAQKTNRHEQVGGRSQGRRAHDFVETRNVIAGHMKRNDPVTRRFLQYLMMRTGEVLLLVRDGKTGRVITAPPEEHLWTLRTKQGLGRASKNEWVNLLEIGPDFFAMTDKLREWHFGFEDYYDVFIWDFVPGASEMDMYNVAIFELRNAWRIRSPVDVYKHQEPILRTLTREKDTMRTRKIKAGENVESLWDTVTAESTEFRIYEMKNDSMTFRSGDELTKNPYLFYNEANVAEDAILFPDESLNNQQSVPFREIKNSISRLEGGSLRSTMKHLAEGLKATHVGEEFNTAYENARDTDSGRTLSVPKIWQTALQELIKARPSDKQEALLDRTGLDTSRKPKQSFNWPGGKNKLEAMERERSFGFKDSFHVADLEPGSAAKYEVVQETINTMLRTQHTGSTDWALFVAEVLDWLKLRADEVDYAQNPHSPWPHSFIIHDAVAAFATMAMFFPEAAAATAQVTEFVQSEQCESFRNSLVFDPQERSKVRPDRRARTSYKYREVGFWSEWKNITESESYFTDIYPIDWSVAVRPIIAQLYRAGIIAPAYCQPDPQCVSGVATASTEPHRPDKLDLFIDYEDPYNSFPMTFPPSYLHPEQWPKLLPRAQTFAGTHPHARFALLRLWSAPHFYPLMVGLDKRQGLSFLDSTARSWEWKFVPKDMPASEFSVHHATERRLELIRKQLGDRVVNRGDLILVMGEDAADLLKYCTAVTFAVQTKPWLREVDLWKSFINVELGFLQQLDAFWLD